MTVLSLQIHRINHPSILWQRNKHICPYCNICNFIVENVRMSRMYGCIHSFRNGITFEFYMLLYVWNVLKWHDDVFMERIWCMVYEWMTLWWGVCVEWHWNLFLVVHYWSMLFSWALCLGVCVESPLEFCWAIGISMLLGFFHQKQWALLRLMVYQYFWALWGFPIKTVGIVVDF